MGYSVDLNQISIFQYMDILKNQNLFPGRKILLENMEENFRRLDDAGIQNLAYVQINSQPRYRRGYIP